MQIGRERVRSMMSLPDPILIHASLKYFADKKVRGIAPHGRVP
jgi:hypothetical protein